MEHESDAKPNMGAYALAYCKLGFHVIPIGKDKRPLVKWEEFQQRKATEEEVTAWWKKWPSANIGVVTGAVPGLVVIDIESAKGIDSYREKHGEPGATLMQRTGKENGIHLLKRHPRDGRIYQNQVKVLPDVDTRGDGGYIVVAPSLHPSGKRYEWIGKGPIDGGGFALITDLEPGVEKLFNPINPGDRGKNKKNTSKDKTSLNGREHKNPDGWVQDFLNGVDDGQRNDWAAKLAGYYLRVFKGDIDQVRETMRMANERNRPPLDWKELEKVIESIASRCGTDDLGNAVGEEIKKIEILKYPDGTRKYNVFLENVDGYAQMTLKELGMFSHFKWRFGEIADYIPTNVKQERWEQKVNKALNEAVIVDIPEEETPMGMVISSIERAILAKDITSDPKYINSRVLMVGDNGDRQICLRIPTVMSMIKFEGDRLTRKEVGELLRKIGFNNKEHVRLDNGNIRCWAIPLDRWKFNTTAKPDK